MYFSTSDVVDLYSLGPRLDLLKYFEEGTWDRGWICIVKIILWAVTTTTLWVVHRWYMTLRALS